MNKRQRQTLGAGALGIMLVFALGVVSRPPPIAGPLVETSPGHLSQSVRITTLPSWAMLASLALVVLTGTLVYQSRNQGEA